MGKITMFIDVPCDNCHGTGKVKVSSIAVLRKKAGLDQEQVAEALGLTRTSISNIERGVQAISLDRIKSMAELYGISEYEMYDIAKQVSGYRLEAES